MKREVKLLLSEAIDSLILAIELFNRPDDRGRVSGTLILLDHSLEMFLKAAILHRGGRIKDKQDRDTKETIGFHECVQRSLTNSNLKYLSEEQALLLQTIHGLRDAVQHYILKISEGLLYIHVQAGVTLFRDLLRSVFGKDLATHLPGRVLPVSTSAPTDLTTLFDHEINEILKLLKPKRRRQAEVVARLRPLAILDAKLRGEEGQPSDEKLARISKALKQGTPWDRVFQGVAAVQIAPDGFGPVLSLRLSKKEGLPIHEVPATAGTPVAIRRINELDVYTLGAQQLAQKLQLTVPKTVAIVNYLGIRKNSECYKEFKIGSQTFKRYSQKAIEKIRAALETETVDEIWAKYKEMNESSSR